MATYECQVVQTRGGASADDVIVNVLHIDEPTLPFATARALDLGNQALNLWQDNFVTGDAGTDGLLRFQHSSVNLDQVRVYKAGEQGIPLAVVHADTSPGSAGSSTVLVPQVALSVSFKNVNTGGPGKVGSRWGRMYLGGLAADVQNASGRVSSANCTYIAKQFAGWAAQLPGACAHVVFSRVDGTAKPITDYQVDDVFDVIRSRRYSGATFRALESYPT